MRRDLTERVKEQLRAWGSHPVFVELRAGHDPMCVSAQEFTDHLRETSSLLETAGIRPGLPVAVMLNNSALFATVFLAILGLDAVPLPLQTDYRAMELDEIMSNARPQAIVVEHAYLETLAPYAHNRTLITAAGPRLAVKNTAPSPGRLPEFDDSVAALLYTYRGYGYPLGALIPPGQLLHGVSVIRDVMQSSPGEAMLAMLSMGHIFGLVCCVFLPLLSGLTGVIPDSLHPHSIYRDLQQHRISCAVGIPEVFGLLWRYREPQLRFPQLRLLISGGSLLSEIDYARIRELFSADLAHGYGLTELTPVSRNIPGSTRPGTVGPVCPGIELRIVPDRTTEGGEIQVRAVDMAQGYHRRPQETAAAFDGSWFRTGDRGVMRAGHLVFLEEIKSTCKVNGRLVDRQEVVRALTSVPGVRAAEVALGGPNVLEARVVLGGRRVDTESFGWLRRCLSAKIASYKIPKRFLTDNCR